MQSDAQVAVHGIESRRPALCAGCWTRYAAMRQVLHQFQLHAHQSSNSTSSPAAPDAAGASDAVPSTSGSSIQCQVVVLGAGFDTTWFQLTSTRTAAAAAAAAQGAEGGVAGGMSAGAAVSSASAGPSTSDAAPAPSAPPPPAAAAASIPSLFGLPRRAGPAAGGAPGGAVPPAPDTAAAAAVLEEHTRYIEVDFPEVSTVCEARVGVCFACSCPLMVPLPRLHAPSRLPSGAQQHVPVLLYVLLLVGMDWAYTACCTSWYFGFAESSELSAPLVNA
jgi:hypothetical protein